MSVSEPRDEIETVPVSSPTETQREFAHQSASEVVIGYSRKNASLGATASAFGYFMGNVVLLSLMTATHLWDIGAMILVFNAVCWYFPFAYICLPYRIEVFERTIVSHSLIRTRQYNLDSVMAVQRSGGRLARMFHYAHVTLIFPDTYLRVPFVMGGIYGLDSRLESEADRKLDEILRVELPSVYKRYEDARRVRHWTWLFLVLAAIVAMVFRIR